MGHSCGKRAIYGGKKSGNVPEKKCRSVFFFVTTYGNGAISVGARKKKQLRNCSRLSKHCTKPAFEDEMPEEDQITATAMVAVAAADEHYDDHCI